LVRVTRVFFYHLIDGCNSLRRRTHLPKRRAEFTEGTPRKRRRPLPVANSAAGGRAPVGGIGLNGFIFQAPGHVGSGQSTESSSSSSSSETSSDTSSDDTSSNSESASESTSDSDSGSDSTSSSSDNLLRPVPRPPRSVECQRKPSQPRYVTSMSSRIHLSAFFVLQARSSSTRIWESPDP
jgi:cytoskeletal protein RodZ